MDAREFWYRYCSVAHPGPNEAQENAIDMFLEAMSDLLWQLGPNSGRSTLRKGMIKFLEEAEGLEDQGSTPSQFYVTPRDDLQERSRWVREFREHMRRGEIRVPPDPFLIDEMRRWTPKDIQQMRERLSPYIIRRGPKPDEEQHLIGNTLTWFGKDPPRTFFRNEETRETVEVNDMQIRMVWDDVFGDNSYAGLSGEEQVQVMIRKMKQMRIIPWD